jgi:hypothetical protein
VPPAGSAAAARARGREPRHRRGGRGAGPGALRTDPNPRAARKVADIE